ncbi:MAG: sodium:proton antiporter [Crocinitomicaceae bacterium]|nr:sodium:proton antiporter [Crocinitomicaceae bacterium]
MNRKLLPVLAFLVLIISFFASGNFSFANNNSPAQEHASTEQTSINSGNLDTQCAHSEEHVQEHHTDVSPLLFIVVCLIIGAAIRFSLSKINLPYTVVLMLIGLGLGVLGRTGFFESMNFFGLELDTSILDHSISWAANIDPHLILYIFLPILIFEAAFAMDVHTFKKSFVNSVILAVPGIIVAVVGTAALMWLIVMYNFGLQSWSWELVLLFGTVISATDPVAVVALKDLGASKKLSTLIDGEAILNDGTAIVIFVVILAGITGNAGDSSPIIDFFRVSFGGVIIGFVIGKIGLRWIRSVFNDMLIEITVIVALAYLTFFICENVFGVSGVLGLMSLGLLFAGPGRTKISPEVQHFIHEFWDFAAFTANTLIFIIVGVVIAERTVFTMNDVWVLLIVYLIIHIARTIMIYMFLPVMRKIGYGVGKNHPQVMIWGALRGAIGLALALIVESTPAIPEQVREQFLFLTAGIVTMTLLINATTMKAVANYLGLIKLSESKIYVTETAKEYLHRQTVNSVSVLEKDRFFKKVNWEALQSYLPKKSKLEELGSIADYKEESRRRILEKEKSSYWSQFKEGMISSGGYSLLVSEINEIIDSGGTKKLSDRGDLDELLATKNSFSKYGIFSKLFEGRIVSNLGDSFDAAKGFYNAQIECQKTIEEMFKLANDNEKVILKEMESEIEENKIQALAFLRNFKNQFPNIYRHVSTRQAIRTILNTEKNRWVNF